MSDLVGSASFHIVKGTTLTLQLTVLDQDGNTVSLASATVYFTVRLQEGDADPPLISKSSANPLQIEILTPQTDVSKKGRANIYLQPTDTLSLGPDQYRYDVWVTIGTARYCVIPPSMMEIRPSVTVLP